MGKRRAFDFYETPASQVRELLARIPIAGLVIEPCAGDGAIARELRAAGLDVLTADVDRRRPADLHGDARDWILWKHRIPALRPAPAAWVITNPPFSSALPILGYALEAATEGVAFLLRLTFLEPTIARSLLYREHPIDQLIVLPRASYTADGRSDNVTTAWFIWYCRPLEDRTPGGPAIQIVPRLPARRQAERLELAGEEGS